MIREEGESITEGKINFVGSPMSSVIAYPCIFMLDDPGLYNSIQSSKLPPELLIVETFEGQISFITTCAEIKSIKSKKQISTAMARERVDLSICKWEQ